MAQQIRELGEPRVDVAPETERQAVSHACVDRRDRRVLHDATVAQERVRYLDHAQRRRLSPPPIGDERIIRIRPRREDVEGVGREEEAECRERVHGTASV